MATCAISGRLPEEPVVAKTTGYVFERRLILKHLELHQTCPISNTPLTPTDLLSLQTSSIVPPRPPTAASFPQLLTTLQNEYDAMLLESFTLRQQLDSVKKELAKQYYTLDASNRVIARLYKENKQLKDALTTMDPTAIASKLPQQSTTTTTTTSSQQQLIQPTLTFQPIEFVTNALQLCTTKISGKENRGTVLKQLPTVTLDANSYLNATIPTTSIIEIPSTNLHTTCADTQYITRTRENIQSSLPSTQFSFVATETGKIIIFQNHVQNQSSSIMTTITIPGSDTNGFTITSLITHHYDNTSFPWLSSTITNQSTMNDTTSTQQFISFIVSTSNLNNQHKIYIYAAPLESIANTTSWQCLHTITSINQIKQLILHPSQQFLISLTTNNMLQFYNFKVPTHTIDLTTGDYNNFFYSTSLPSTTSNDEAITIQIHPDGRLLLIGSTAGYLTIFNCTDLTFGTPIAPQQQSEPIKSIDISQTATNVITVSNQTFSLWSLKTSSIIHTQTIPQLQSVQFDHTGKYIIVTTTNKIILFDVKTYQQLHEIIIPSDIKITNALIQQDNKAIIAIGQKQILFIYPHVIA